MSEGAFIFITLCVGAAFLMGLLIGAMGAVAVINALYNAGWIKVAGEPDR